MWNVFQDILLFKHTNGENHIYSLYQLSKNGSKRKDIQTYLFRHLLKCLWDDTQETDNIVCFQKGELAN